MEAATSCSILHSLPFSSTTSNYHNKQYTEIPLRNSNSNLHLGLPFPSTFPRNHHFPVKSLQQNLFTTFCSTSSYSNQNPSPELAVLLEVDGKSAGDEERMLVLFFNRIGWPTSLPTSEKGPFVKSVLREKKNALDEFAVSKSLLLRPGVQEFIDDATNKGIPVAILTAYGRSEEKIARSIIEKLGHERISKLKIIGNEEVEKSLYGQLILNKGLVSGLDEELAKEARKAVSAQKQRIAEDVASMLKLKVSIDSNSSESLAKVVAALRAGAEYCGVPLNNCVLIAGSQSGVAGAECIGMPCIVVRSSSTSRTQFPSAKATVDGFGGPDLTISKLLQKRLS